MQIMVISLPSGEQIPSLNYTLDADEIYIGQASSCHIQLTDQQHNIADKHARLIHEDDQWYVENTSNRTLMINQTDVPKQSQQRFLLNDGDILSCGGYQLVASHFSPWQSRHVAMEPPELALAEDQAPEFCAMPFKDNDAEYGQLNDPFAEHLQNQDRSNQHHLSSELDATMTNADLSVDHRIPHTPNHKSLIDVLSKNDDLDSDWIIHRELWCGHSHEPESNQSTELPPSSRTSEVSSTQHNLDQSFFDKASHIPSGALALSPQQNSSQTTANNKKYQKSLYQAMLQALDLTMEDMSPDALEQYFKQASIDNRTYTKPTNKLLRYLTRWGKQHSRQNAEPNRQSNFQNSYQCYYQQLISSKQYRLLFLQRFRQALKEQEQ